MAQERSIEENSSDRPITYQDEFDNWTSYLGDSFAQLLIKNGTAPEEAKKVLLELTDDAKKNWLLLKTPESQAQRNIGMSRALYPENRPRGLTGEAKSNIVTYGRLSIALMEIGKDQPVTPDSAPKEAFKIKTVHDLVRSCMELVGLETAVTLYGIGFTHNEAFSVGKQAVEKTKKKVFQLNTGLVQLLSRRTVLPE